MHCMTVAYFKFSSVQISEVEEEHLVNPDGERPLRQVQPSTLRRIITFNIAIAFSIILIVLEALCYDVDIHQDQLIPFYGVRLGYYCVLVIFSIAGAVLICCKKPVENAVEVSCVVD